MPEKNSISLKVYTTKDKEWNEYINAAPAPDIYFRAEYAAIYEQTYTPMVDAVFGGEALLFVHGTKKDFVAAPFMKRRIAGTDLYDLASPYGYTGPLIKTKAGNEMARIKKFHAALEAYAEKNNVVSALVRLSPLLRNHILEEGVEKVGNTVIVDLTKNEHALLAEMGKKARTAMRKAQREGVCITAAPPKGQQRNEAVRDLALLYTASMQKNNASEHYFFPQKFFENTVNMLGGHATILIARYNETPVAAAVFIHHYDKMHYHLSGIEPNYHLLYPTNLLLFEAARFGRKNGFRILHLGGGVTGSDGDSLFKFKASIAKGRSEYYVKKIIFDKRIYDDLTNKRMQELQLQGKEPRQGFFPAYRV